MLVQTVVGCVENTALKPFDSGLVEIIVEHRVPVFLPDKVFLSLLAPEGIDIVQGLFIQSLVLFNAFYIGYILVHFQMRIVPFRGIIHNKTLL